MKTTPRLPTFRRTMLCSALLAAGFYCTQPAWSQPRAPARATTQPTSREPVTLNFVNAEIDAVVGAIGQMTNRTFVVDPRVRGTLTLATPAPVPADEAYRLLLATLRLQGFAVVEDGEVVKVVPEADAKLQSGRVQGGQGGVRGDQIITQVFRLNYESATNLVPVLRPLISPNNTIAAYPANNSLVITDYADNLRRIEKILANVDVPAAVDLEVIPLQHAIAIDLATMLSKLLDEGRTQGTDPGQRVSILADSRTNALLMRAGSKSRADLARSLIAKLDQPSARGNNINVIYLKNAEATKLAQTLRSILTGDTSAQQQAPTQSFAGTQMQTTGTQGLNPAGSPPQTTPSFGNSGSQAPSLGSFGSPSGGGSQGASGSQGGQTGVAGMIQADASTNTLIITAPEPIYRNIREIVEKLDARRAQVLVESLIVEVSTDLSAEFGVQWQALSGLNSTDTRVIGGTNFGGAGTNIIGGAKDLTSLGNGLNLGIIKGIVKIAGNEITNLGFLARALESSGQANILSTPNVLTLDNETATFIVGQNVPFITGQYASTGAATSTVSPFQTIERRDVGLTLKVKPQISEGGIVRLQIYQEQSSVANSTAQGLITNKRSIDTTVLVDNGNIVVLGGLIEDSGNNGMQKVPVLGDIPVLGGLFRYQNRSRKKTNLMVFLRPYILRDTAQSNSVLLDRYDYMRAQGANARTPPSWVLPDYSGPQMTPLDPQTNTVKPPTPLIQVPVPKAPPAVQDAPTSGG